MRADAQADSVARWAALVASVALAGCGGGGGGGSGAAPAGNVQVSGQVVAGPVGGATVDAYEVDPQTRQLTLIGRGATDAQGAFSLSLSGAGPVLFVARGGAYADEATGMTRALADPGALQSLDDPRAGTLEALLGLQEASFSPMVITPLSTFAARRSAELGRQQASAFEAAAVLQTARNIGREFGLGLPAGADVRKVAPLDFTSPADAAAISADPTGDAATAGAILSALSQRASELGLLDPLDLVEALAMDITDGAFDGLADAGGVVAPVPLGTQSLTASAGTSELSAALQSFLDTNANNASGASSATLSATLASLSSQELQKTGNRAPQFDAIADVTLQEDASALTVSVTGLSANDAGQSVTLTATSSNPAILPAPMVSPAGPTQAGQATLTLLPASDRFGSVTVTLRAQDDGGTQGGGFDSFQRSFRVTIQSVNDRPTLDFIADLSVAPSASSQSLSLGGVSGGPFESQATTVTAQSSDSSVVRIDGISPSGASPDDTRDLSYTPLMAGSATITVTADDNSGQTFQRSFVMTVQAGAGAGNAPSFDAIASPSIPEDSATQVLTITSISANDAGEQVTSLSAQSSNPALIPNPSISFSPGAATATLSYSPVADAFGSATITVTATDSGASNSLGTGSFTVTVSPVNDAPSFDALPDLTLTQGAPAQTVSLANLSAGPGELEAVSLSAATSDAAVTPNLAAAAASLSFDVGAPGQAIITVTADDQQGANSSFQRSFTVTVNASGVGITSLSPEAASLAGGTALRVTTSGFAQAFSQGGAPTASIGGQAATVTVISATSVDVTVPAGLSAGPQSLVLSLGGDSASRSVELVSAVATDEVFINELFADPNPGGGQPIVDANNDGVLSDQDDEYVELVNGRGVAADLSNFTFSDGSSQRHIFPNPTVIPAGGSLVLFGGGAPFGFAPAQQDGAAQVASSGDLGLSNGGDTLTLADTLGNPVHVLSTTSSPNAKAANRDPDGDPTAGFSDHDAVSGAGSAIISPAQRVGGASFSGNQPANAAPSFDKVADVNVDEDAGPTMVSLSNVSANDPGQSVLITAVSDNPALIPNLVISPAGPSQAATRTLTFSPAANASGSAEVTIVAIDSGAGAMRAIDTFDITVAPLNDAPSFDVIADLSVGLGAGAQTVTITAVSAGPGEVEDVTVTAQSSDPRISIDSISPAGPSQDSTRTLTFSPSASMTGSATITVTADDGQGGTSQRSFTVTILSGQQLTQVVPAVASTAGGTLIRIDTAGFSQDFQAQAPMVRVGGAAPASVTATSASSLELTIAAGGAVGPAAIVVTAGAETGLFSGFELVAPIAPGDAHINELLTDPGPSGSPVDANGDGNADSTDDEFIELVNTRRTAIDLSGFVIYDNNGSNLRHTFPNPTTVPPQGSIVVFAGGSPTGFAALHASGAAQVASSGSLGLGNSGETLTFESPTRAIIDRLQVGSSTDGVSFNRQIDGRASALTVLHDTLSSQGFSPGARADGRPFNLPPAGLLASDTALESISRIDAGSGQTMAVQSFGLRGFKAIEGLAWDPATSSLFAADRTRDALLRIDPATDATTVIGLIGFDEVKALAYDSASGILYGADDGAKALIRIDTATGEGTLIGGFGAFDDIKGMAFGPGGALFGVNESSDELVTIDTASGATTLVGTLGTAAASPNGLAYDGSVLLTVDAGQSDSLYSIDPASGAATLVGAHGFTSVKALTRDPATGTLYAYDDDANRVLILDRATGQATTSTVTGFKLISSCAYDADNRKVYVIDIYNQLIDVDPVTGQGRIIGETTFLIAGLAFDSGNGVLYGVQLGGDGQVVTIDTSTAAATPLPNTIGSGLGAILGLAFDGSQLIGVQDDLGSQRLVFIDPISGLSTSTQTLTTGAGVGLIQGLGFDDAGQALYGVDANGQLIAITLQGAASVIGDTGFDSIQALDFGLNGRVIGANDRGEAFTADPATGRGRGLGSCGFDKIEGLAFDSNSGTFYGVDGDFARLVTVDPLTNEGSFVGRFGAGFSVEGLAYDPNAQVLYGSDVNGNQLLRIDTATGAATIVGPFNRSGARVTGLAFDPATSTLYGCAQSGNKGELLTINTATGAATLIGEATDSQGADIDDIEGLAWDPATNTLYGSSRDGEGGCQVYAFDRVTAVGVEINGPGGRTRLTNVQGLAFGR